jgi:hypothetical protein
MKIAKRVSALVLSFLLILTMMPSVAQTAKAEGEGTVTITYNLGEGKGTFTGGSSTYTATLTAKKDYYGNTYYSSYAGINYNPNLSTQQVVTGWVDANDPSKVYPEGSEIKVTQSTTLNAQWEDAWKITLHGNGGTFATGSNVYFQNYNSTYDKSLDQWIRKSHYVGVETGNTDTVVAYVKKGDSLIVDGVGTNINNADATKSLLGWAVNADGSGETVAPNAGETSCTLTPESDKDLYATWGTVTKYTVTFKAGENGRIRTGYDASSNPVYVNEITKTVRENTQAYGLVNSDATNYADNTKVFVGWKDQDGKFYRNLSFIITKDLTLTAQYIDAVRVTLKGTEYTSSPANGATSDYYVGKGFKITQNAMGIFNISGSYENANINMTPSQFSLKDPSYALGGLKITDAAGHDITKTITTVDQDIIIEPVVATESVKLNFDLQGAYPKSGNDSIFTNKMVAKGTMLSDVVGSSVIAPKDYIRETNGKLCVGFTTTKNDASTLITFDNIKTIKLDADTTLYALLVDDVKATFDANGGYLNGDRTKTSDYDYYRKDGKDFPTYWPYTPSIDNTKKAFNGYSKEKNGKALTIDEVKAELMADSVKNITLYASWTDAYVITYDANGGYFKNWSPAGGSVNSSTYDRSVIAGSTINIGTYLAYIDDPHYIFDGWIIDGVHYGTYDQYTVNSDTKVIAKWDKASVITFDYNGQTLPAATQNYGKTISIKNGEKWNGMSYSLAPVPEGKMFAGFTTVKDDINTLIDRYNPLTVTGDTTVYAYYSNPANYTVTWGDGYYIYMDGDNETHSKTPLQEKAAVGSKINGVSEYGYADDDSKSLYGFSADGVTYEARPSSYGFDFYKAPVAKEGLTLSAVYTDNTKYTINYNGKTLDGKASLDDVEDAKGRTLDRDYLLEQEVFSGDRNGTYTYLSLNDAMVDAKLQDKLVGFSLTADGTEMIDDGYKLDAASTIYMIWDDTVIGTPTDTQAASNADRAISNMTDTEVKDLAASTAVPSTKDDIYKKSAALNKVALDNNGKIDPKNFSVPSGSTVNIKAIEEVKNTDAITSFKTVLTSIVGNISKENATVQKTELFDLNATGQGKVMIYVGKEYAGMFSVVGHYNSGGWTTQQCKIDVNGYVTPAFNSFSPVFIAVTTSNNELASVTTNEPAVVSAPSSSGTAGTTGKTKASPKTGLPAPSGVQVALIAALLMLGGSDLIEMLRKKRMSNK